MKVPYYGMIPHIITAVGNGYSTSLFFWGRREDIALRKARKFFKQDLIEQKITHLRLESDAPGTGRQTLTKGTQKTAEFSHQKISEKKCGAIVAPHEGLMGETVFNFHRGDK